MASQLLPNAMDYAALREEGIRQLERLSGPWTDFNTHDPGITLLEQLCYALTDLGYRAAHELPDLLAEDGADPYRSLHLPEQVLTCSPVTPADLRRVVLDVDGVQNAWVEPLAGDTQIVYYHLGPKTLSLSPTPLPSEPVPLQGLYRVLVDPKLGASSDLRANVALRLHRSRGLCEDFAEITVLEPQKITVDAVVEIDAVDDPGELGRRLVQQIADVISPPVPFCSLDEALRMGLSLDAVLDGPRLAHGFVSDDALKRATRRTAVNTSDLIHAVRDLPEVRAVSRLRIFTSEQTSSWSLAIPPGKVAKLDRDLSSIVLRNAGKVVARVASAGTASAALDTPVPGAGLTRPAGRDRHVLRYTSVQRHLPAIYGVGDHGLVDSAAPERKSRANQLRAYLMFFDQLMANHLAQLAHVKDLLSHDDVATTTYFAQPVEQPDRAADVLRDRSEQDLLASSLAAGDPAGAEPLDLARRNRFLNHLLSRFAETVGEHGALAPEALLRAKQAFLRGYPVLGGARGAGFSYLEPAGPDNGIALEQRIALKLGLTTHERLRIVEHILLRPMEGDELQQVPLVTAPFAKDPYSLQLTFALRSGTSQDVGRFADDEFRTLVEQTIREETPAHLTAYVRWIDAADWPAFETAHTAWLDRRREYWAAQLGLTLAPEVSPP
ncbi:MAG TPA: hypothetical protein VF516_45430 [Kofleriaceae bacterium]